MTDVLERTPTPEVVPRGRRLGPPTVVLVGALIVALAATAVTAMTLTRHYTQAEPLTCACGVAWAAPDNRFVRYVDDEFGAPSRSQVPARPGHTQSFYVLIVNPSTVTQTVLGLPAVESVAEPDHLAVAVDTGRRNEDEPDGRRFATAPTDIPPGGERWLRMSHETAAYDRGRTEVFTDLYLRVRAGGFTRTETISLEGGSPTISWG